MAKLTAKKRAKLPAKSFGLAKDKAYPIDTPARARNALARAAQHATPAEQRTIQRKVAAKYPGIEVTKTPPSKGKGK